MSSWCWESIFSCVEYILLFLPVCYDYGISLSGMWAFKGGLFYSEGRCFCKAWYLHPFIYGIGLLTAVFVIRRYILHKETGSLKKWLIFLLAGMFVFYIYRMIRYFPGEPPMSYYPGNLLSRIAQAFQVLIGREDVYSVKSGRDILC